MESTKTQLKRIVEISPAFDKRHSDPSKNYKNYGIGCCRLRMVLKGDKGATQFVLLTGWYLPHVQSELNVKPDSPYSDLEMPPNVMAMDVSYHSPRPMYEGQTPMGDCDVLDGQCYYDGSSLQAQDVYRILVEEGSEGVWRELEYRYNDLFGLPCDSTT